MSDPSPAVFSGSSDIPLRYAGLMRRSVALSIDMALASIPYLALEAVLEAPLADVLSAALMVYAYVYFFASSWQGTPGMKWLGIKAVDEHGQPIGHGRAFAWCLANSAGLVVAMGGMLYLQYGYDTDGAMVRLQTGDVAGAEALLGMSFDDFYQLVIVATVVFCVVSLLWTLSIAFSKQKAGLLNTLVGVRFVRG